MQVELWCGAAWTMEDFGPSVPLCGEWGRPGRCAWTGAMSRRPDERANPLRLAQPSNPPTTGTAHPNLVVTPARQGR